MEENQFKETFSIKLKENFQLVFYLTTLFSKMCRIGSVAGGKRRRSPLGGQGQVHNAWSSGSAPSPRINPWPHYQPSHHHELFEPHPVFLSLENRLNAIFNPHLTTKLSGRIFLSGPVRKFAHCTRPTATPPIQASSAQFPLPNAFSATQLQWN